MSKKHKKTHRNLNYFQHSLLFISAVTGCLSVSVFATLVDISVGNTSSAVGLKICAITDGIKKYKSIIKKKRKMHDRTVLLGKANLDTIEVLISNALIDSSISHKEFVSLNTVLREYNELKEEIKNPETSVEYAI